MSEANGSARLGVFISWSGSESRAVAVALRDWIPRVLQAVNPWMSTEDLHGRWTLELARALDQFDFGLVCVTPGNVASPWMNFEAGALSKAFDSSELIPVLHRATTASVAREPLGMFQHAVSTDRERMRWMIGRLNDACGELRLTDELLTDAFDHRWPEFADRLSSVEASEPQEEAQPADAEDLLPLLLDQLNSQGAMIERLTVAVERTGEASRNARRQREANAKLANAKLRSQQLTSEILAMSGSSDPPLPTDNGWVKEGRSVKHPAFGIGTVVLVSGEAGEAEAIIDFEAGTKHLALPWTPLTPMDGDGAD